MASTTGGLNKVNTSTFATMLDTLNVFSPDKGIMAIFAFKGAFMSVMPSSRSWHPEDRNDENLWQQIGKFSQKCSSAGNTKCYFQCLLQSFLSCPCAEKSKAGPIKLLECPIPLSSSSSVLCHKKSGSLLFLQYFSNLVKWISPKLQTVFLTTQL